MIYLLLALVACATPYQPRGYSGGFSEVRLNERAFRVTFEGNGHTSRVAAQQGAMHRAADLTLQFGYFGFWVVGQDNNVSSYIHNDPVSCSTVGASTTCNGGDSRLVNLPDTTMTINMVTWQEAMRPPPGVVVYDARLIASQMQ